MLLNFLVRMLKYLFINFKMFFCPQKLKKPPQKVAYLHMAVGRFFFSAAPTAQNSPEPHFRFIDNFIQSSLLRSLYIVVAECYLQIW